MPKGGDRTSASESKSRGYKCWQPPRTQACIPSAVGLLCVSAYPEQRQVFSATRQSVLLAFINQVLSIVSYPTFISPALKGWMDEEASGSLLGCDLGEYV